MPIVACAPGAWPHRCACAPVVASRRARSLHGPPVARRWRSAAGAPVSRERSRLPLVVGMVSDGRRSPRCLASSRCASSWAPWSFGRRRRRRGGGAVGAVDPAPEAPRSRCADARLRRRRRPTPPPAGAARCARSAMPRRRLLAAPPQLPAPPTKSPRVLLHLLALRRRRGEGARGRGAPAPGRRTGGSPPPPLPEPSSRLVRPRTGLLPSTPAAIRLWVCMPVTRRRQATSRERRQPRGSLRVDGAVAPGVFSCVGVRSSRLVSASSGASAGSCAGVSRWSSVVPCVPSSPAPADDPRCADHDDGGDRDAAHSRFACSCDSASSCSVGRRLHLWSSWCRSASASARARSSLSTASAAASRAIRTSRAPWQFARFRYRLASSMLIRAAPLSVSISCLMALRSASSPAPSRIVAVLPARRPVGAPRGAPPRAVSARLAAPPGRRASAASRRRGSAASRR